MMRDRGVIKKWLVWQKVIIVLSSMILFVMEIPVSAEVSQATPPRFAAPTGEAQTTPETSLTPESPPTTSVSEVPTTTEVPSTTSTTEASVTTESPPATTASEVQPPTEALSEEVTTEEEIPQHVPKMVASSVVTEPEVLEPGKDLTITIGLKNTSKDAALYNMKISYECPGGDLIPYDASPSRYVSYVAAGGSTTLIASFHVPKDLENYNPKIDILMEYEDEKAVSYSSTETVNITVIKPLGFHADAPIVPQRVESGLPAEISVNLFNTGKSMIYNVYCKMECRGFLDSGTYYYGNIEPESSITATLNPIASNRQYGVLGDPHTDKYGTVEGKIIITYEDENGETYTQEMKVRTEITMPEKEKAEQKPDIETIHYNSQWWVSIVVLLVIIDVLVIIAAYYIRKHRV